MTGQQRDTSMARTQSRGPDDTADVALAASGDGHAFERLYRQYVARIHSLARRMVGPARADELTQDVFVRVWEKLATFRGESAFGTWLHRLAINVMLSERGRLGRERARLAVGDAAATNVAARSHNAGLAMDLETALETLPDGARRVFVLHDVEGYKHQEIGTLLNIAPGTSKAQLHRARMLLRERLTGGKEGV